MDSILEISSVSQAFRTGFWLRPKLVLQRISFKVPRKTIFGFLGANGAGKTTLIHLITGLRKPSQGSVKVLGYESTSAEAKSQIGYLPERPYFHEHLTGQQLLEYFGTLAGMKPNRIQERIPSVLSAVRMLDSRKVELKKYSKGMLQRIGIAQALLHDPEFLVLDEPMSGLDPMGRKEMRELILKLAAEGRTIFFSSHVIPDVEAICAQAALIQKGQIIGCGPIASFLPSNEDLIELIFSGERLDLPQFKSITETPVGYRALVCGQKAIDEILPILLEKKSKILGIQPIRPSLEDFFVKKGDSSIGATS
jgi:ABC-2 type transport system ATP-binding protein